MLFPGLSLTADGFMQGNHRFRSDSLLESEVIEIESGVKCYSVYLWSNRFESTPVSRQRIPRISVEREMRRINMLQARIDIRVFGRKIEVINLHPRSAMGKKIYS